MFPLPIDKIKNWIIYETSDNTSVKLLPCKDLKITDIWTVSLPKFISEAPMRSLDVNSDGIEDIIIGFGTETENILGPDLFCPIFMGKEAPCGGGVIALDGKDGSRLWITWLHHTVFSIICSEDIDGDKKPECLVTGKGGVSNKNLLDKFFH